MRNSGSVSPELNLKFFMTKSSSTISGSRNCVGACSTSETSNAANMLFSFRRLLAPGFVHFDILLDRRARHDLGDHVERQFVERLEADAGLPLVQLQAT